MKAHSKAIGAGFGAAIATLIVWGLELRGFEVPDAVNGAIAVIITSVVVWLAPANKSEPQ